MTCFFEDDSNEYPQHTCSLGVILMNTNDKFFGGDSSEYPQHTCSLEVILVNTHGLFFF